MTRTNSQLHQLFEYSFNFILLLLHSSDVRRSHRPKPRIPASASPTADPQLLERSPGSSKNSHPTTKTSSITISSLSIFFFPFTQFAFRKTWRPPRAHRPKSRPHPPSRTATSSSTMPPLPLPGVWSFKAPSRRWLNPAQSRST